MSRRRRQRRKQEDDAMRAKGRQWRAKARETQAQRRIRAVIVAELRQQGGVRHDSVSGLLQYHHGYRPATADRIVRDHYGDTMRRLRHKEFPLLWLCSQDGWEATDAQLEHQVLMCLPNSVGGTDGESVGWRLASDESLPAFLTYRQHARKIANGIVSYDQQVQHVAVEANLLPEVQPAQPLPRLVMPQTDTT